MTQSTGPLEFFIVEATEHVETLDALLGTASRAGPDPERFGKTARGLRGSATMARQYGIADLASALERAARGLRENRLRWDPMIHAAMVAAVDDLRILLRAVRTWGMREEERVLTRLAELDRIVPAIEGTTTRITPRATGAGAAFLAKQAGELAEALSRFCATPSDQGSLDAALERARTLRGVAALRDLPPLPDIVDAIDDVGRHISLGGRPPTSTQVALFDAAASVLRLAAKEISSGGRPETGGVAIQLFGMAVAALAEEESSGERIVPIAELFHSGTIGIIHASTHPPTTSAQRFRLEVVSQAEHLRRLLGDARLPGDAVAGERVRRDLESAIDALYDAADSFGERRVARFLKAWRERVLAKDPRAMSAMDDAAALLADISCTPERLAAGLERLHPEEQATPAAAASPAPAAPQPAPTPQTAPEPQPVPEPVKPAPAPPARRRRTPSGRDLHDALAVGLNGFSDLGSAPLDSAVPIAEEAVVPIEMLLYRGRAALERARTLREELRRAGGHPSEDELQELYDLIELASTE